MKKTRGSGGRWKLLTSPPKKKRSFRDYSPEALRAAMQARLSGSENGQTPPSYRKLAMQFRVPSATIQRCFTLFEKSGDTDVSSFTLPAVGRGRYLTLAEEELLLQKAIDQNSSGFGCDRSQFKRMAREVVAANWPDMPQAEVDKLITNKWLSGFQKRHDRLTFRKSTKLDYKRARTANPAVLRPFYEQQCEMFIKKHNHGEMCKPYQVCNSILHHRY